MLRGAGTDGGPNRVDQRRGLAQAVRRGDHGNAARGCGALERYQITRPRDDDVGEQRGDDRNRVRDRIDARDRETQRLQQRPCMANS